MKTIAKHFQTIRQAERYQDRLYNRFDVVRLVRFPLFDEAGSYVWEVQ